MAEDDLADLDLARAGDDDAMRRLIARHGAGMLRNAHRVLGPTGDVEDAVQEALVAALVTPTRPHGDVGAWLRAIAARKALDQGRRRSRRAEQQLPEDDGRLASGAPAAPGLIDRDRLERALAALSPSDRALLVLVDVEGFSLVEAARELGVSRVAARLRAMRARRRLAERLGAVPERK